MSDDNQSANDNNTQDVNTLPEWGRRAISDANAEAAKYRLAAKTAADEAVAQTKVEYDKQIQAISTEKSAIAAERDKAVSDISKLTVTIKAQIPGESAFDFAGLLQGSTPEELTAHAEKLKSMLGTGTKTRAVDPSQGATGDGGAKTAADLFADMVKNKLTK